MRPKADLLTRSPYVTQTTDQKSLQAEAGRKLVVSSTAENTLPCSKSYCHERSWILEKFNGDDRDGGRILMVNGGGPEMVNLSWQDNPTPRQGEGGQAIQLRWDSLRPAEGFVSSRSDEVVVSAEYDLLCSTWACPA